MARLWRIHPSRRRDGQDCQDLPPYPGAQDQVPFGGSGARVEEAIRLRHIYPLPGKGDLDWKGILWLNHFPDPKFSRRPEKPALTVARLQCSRGLPCKFPEVIEANNRLLIVEPQ